MKFEEYNRWKLKNITETSFKQLKYYITAFKAEFCYINRD
jgi:hypothetical protein